MKPVNLKKVPTDSLSPNAYNPNEMEAGTFNQLAEDIAGEDLDQPIVVRRVDGKLIIVDGEHRWKAANAAGIQEVYVSEKEMTEDEAMIATVRRNSLRGSMDRVKFTELVRKVSLSTKAPVEEIRTRMGLQDREFAKTFLGMTDAKKTAAAALSHGDKNVAIIMAVANLSQTVREIAQVSGDTIQQGYISFAYKGSVHLMVSMDATLQKAVQGFVSACKADGLTQAELSSKLTAALKEAS